MRIYTEVNYEWDDKQGKLVETSSESFDYQGEMALCKWEYMGADWESLGFDDYGIEYQVRGNKQATYYSGWQVQKRLPGGDWQEHQYSEGDDDSRQIMINHAIASITNPRTGAGGSYDSGLHVSKAEWETWYTDTTHMEPTDDAITNAEVVERAQSDEWTYVSDAAGEADWRKISTLEEDAGWTEVKPGFWEETGVKTEPESILDPDKPGEFDFEKLSGETTRAATELALLDMIKQWEEIITPGGFDVVESEVRGYISNLTEKEENVKTAFEDIFGAEGEEKGSIWDVMEKWETSKERGEEKYTTDIGTAVTEREEGLEDTVVGREGELKALREEAGGEIRAAEAKIGAAGFASTGVGQTAREALAEEIGEAARDIDVGFTEERSDVKQSYLEKTDPLEKEFGTGGTAYDDYITTRDLEATIALNPWKTATAAYEREKERYEDISLPGVTDPTAGSAALALGDIGVSMMEMITTQIGGTDLTDPDPDWDPFATGGFLAAAGYSDPSQFGLMGETFFYTGVPETTWDEPFYEPYTADPGLQLYDPEKLLPWEQEDSETGLTKI